MSIQDTIKSVAPIKVTGCLPSYGSVQNITLAGDLHISPFYSSEDLDDHISKWKPLGISWEYEEECAFLEIEFEGESYDYKRFPSDYKKYLKRIDLSPLPHKFPLNAFKGKKQGDKIVFNYELPIKGEKIEVPVEITLKQELGKFEDILKEMILQKNKRQKMFEENKAVGRF